MSAEKRPVIIAAYRTAIASAYGALSQVEAQDLVAPLICKILDETKIAPEQIDDVILGNAAGGGGNVARFAALTAGLPFDVAGQTVDRQCGSGLEAVVQACRLIEAGAGTFYLAGGVESVSTAPLRAHRPKISGEELQFFTKAKFAPDHIGDPDMGVAAENVAKRFGVTRQRQDAFALQSHQRAVQAQKMGAFTHEIVSLATQQGTFHVDDCPRAGISLKTLERLKPVFKVGGSVTAGNACPINDGAAVVMVTSLAMAKTLDISSGLMFIDSAVAGVDPNILGVGPVASTQKLCQRQPWLDLNKIDYIEFNEAFSAQVLASLDALAIDSQRVNLEGGAIALGHPFGASGTILVTRLFSQMKRAKTTSAKALGLAMMGIGGGMGLTTLFQHYHHEQKS